MITSELSKAGPYAGDGETKTFDFDFKVFDASHIAVYVNGTRTDSGFTAELLSEVLPSAGRVTFGEAPEDGTAISIIRDVPAKQEVELQNNTAFLPKVLEHGLDKLTMMIQQLRDLISRAPLAPPTEDTTSEELYGRFAGALEEVEEMAAAAAASAAAAANAAVDAIAVSGITPHNADAGAHEGAFAEMAFRKTYTHVKTIAPSDIVEDTISVGPTFGNVPDPPPAGLLDPRTVRKVYVRCIEAHTFPSGRQAKNQRTYEAFMRVTISGSPEQYAIVPAVPLLAYPVPPRTGDAQLYIPSTLYVSVSGNDMDQITEFSKWEYVTFFAYNPAT